jgi:hypothetical protein
MRRAGQSSGGVLPSVVCPVNVIAKPRKGRPLLGMGPWCNKIKRKLILILLHKIRRYTFSIIKSRLSHRKHKLRIHKTWIRPVLSNYCEACTVTKSSAGSLAMFERKILRRIFGPVCKNKNLGCRLSIMKRPMNCKTDLHTYLLHGAESFLRR